MVGSVTWWAMLLATNMLLSLSLSKYRCISGLNHEGKLLNISRRKELAYGYDGQLTWKWVLRTLMALSKEHTVMLVALLGIQLKEKIKTGFCRDGSSVRGLAALAGDLNPLASTHVGWHTTAWLPAPGDLTPRCGFCSHCTHMAYTHRHIIQKKKPRTIVKRRLICFLAQRCPNWQGTEQKALHTCSLGILKRLCQSSCKF